MVTPSRQVQAVLSSRLQSAPWSPTHVFDEAALEMVARNVANNSGDLRHAVKVGGEGATATCLSPSVSLHVSISVSHSLSLSDLSDSRSLFSYSLPDV